MTIPPPDTARRPPPYVLAATLGIFGTGLIIGGVQLLGLGGSAWYLVAGVALVTSCVMLWRGDLRGVWLYGALLLATVTWSLWEVGLDFWALAPRLGMMLVLGLWLALPWSRGGLIWGGAPPKPHAAYAAIAAAVALIVGLALTPRATIQISPPIVSLASTNLNPMQARDWTAYGKDASGNRFVPATQITAANVSALKVAWTFRTGERYDGPTVNEATPLKVGDTLFLCTPRRQVIALDAETGRELWRFRPRIHDLPAQFPTVCRGVSYHEAPGRTGQCARRILTAGLDGDLRALDAATGRPCIGFGINGMISLLDGFRPMASRDMVNTSPGVVIGNAIVLGAFVVDGKSTRAPSGVVRAFDVTSGALLWAWDMGRPDPVKALHRGEVFTESTPNAWAPFSADPRLGLIYVPTGNPSPDFFGRYRRSFDETYGSSLVALDARTGRPRWHFQTVHHDLWDLDLPAQPILVDLKTANGVRHAVVQLTKTGDIFVLDRATGAPILPVREAPVPQRGGVPDDRLAPTQPVSFLSLRPKRLTEADMWGITPIDQMICRIRLKRLRNDGPFTPPGTTPAIGYPASSAVLSWGGGTVDPRSGELLVSTTYMPMITRLIPRSEAPPAIPHSKRGEYMLLEQKGTPYRYLTEPMLGPLAVPCSRPPWGELVGIDLNKGKILWRKFLGTGRDNGPLGIPSMLPLPISTPNSGGNVLTGGGLSFIGATTDRYLRAFDIRNGREVWRASLPAGANATPMSYVSAPSGRQFVVVTAGGNDAIRSRKGDYLIAFSLSKEIGRVDNGQPQRN